MTGARGKDGNVSTPDGDFMTARPTQHQPRRSGGEPEHFMRGRMIVLVGEDAVPPLRRPAVAPEERFESRSRFLGIFAHDDAAVNENRLDAYGRAALRALVALDEGPALDARPNRDVVTLRKVLPPWAVRLLIGSLLLAPLVVTIDGFARARRRQHPVTPWLGWIGAAAAPFALAAAFATVLGITGLLTATPPAPVPAGAIPIDGAGRAALIATGLVFVLVVLARPLVLRLMNGRRRIEGPGGGAALLLVWTALAALLWLVNPYAAAFMVPAAHLWLLVAAPGVRLRRSVALALVALSLLPFAIGALVLTGQRGFGPLDALWGLLLAVAGGQVGPIAWLFWSVAAGCAVAAIVLAWRTRRGPLDEPGEPRITVRGPVTYAGPGSLGGTESALRR